MAPHVKNSSADRAERAKRKKDQALKREADDKARALAKVAAYVKDAAAASAKDPVRVIATPSKLKEGEGEGEDPDIVTNDAGAEGANPASTEKVGEIVVVATNDAGTEVANNASEEKEGESAAKGEEIAETTILPELSKEQDGEAVAVPIMEAAAEVANHASNEKEGEGAVVATKEAWGELENNSSKSNKGEGESAVVAEDKATGQVDAQVSQETEGEMPIGRSVGHALSQERLNNVISVPGCNAVVEINPPAPNAHVTGSFDRYLHRISATINGHVDQL